MLLKKRLSFTRFRVVGKFSFSGEEYQKSLMQHSFRDLHLEDEESCGWVSVVTCLKFPQIEEMMRDPYLCLSMRIDKRKLSKVLFDANMAIEEKAALLASGKDRLSTNERRELKRIVKKKLLEDQTPNSTLVSAIWNFSTGTCYLFSTSPGVQKRFCKLFNETFLLDLAVMTPWELASTWAQKNNASEKLQETEQACFTGGKK